MYRLLIVAACVGAFALLCRDATRRLADAYPSLPECRRDPVRHDGKPIWFNPVPVISIAEGSFEVRHWGMPVRVRSPLQPEIGAEVMVYGTFHRDGTVSAIAWEAEHRYFFKRQAALVVSLLVVVVGLFVFRRSFEWRDGAFHPR